MNKDIFVKALNLRRKIHQYPELSGEEVETKKRIRDFLKENTNLEVVDRGAWVYAKYTAPVQPAKSMAFRADFDAIKVNEENDLHYASVNKGVSHKCGHDGHTAALAAFAMEVDEQGCDCNVYFIFQHGEETGIGGKVCAGLIEEEGIEEVYAVHNWPSAPFGSLGIREGIINCASKGIELHFTGKPAHASYPETGICPAATISKIVLSMDEMVKRDVYKGLVLATVIQIDLGERAFGVAAHEGRLLLTIRGEYEKELLMLEEEILELAGHEAEREGLELEVSYDDEFPETYNAPEAIAKLRDIATENGWPLNEMVEPIRASEDFGYYLKKAPGALIWLGAGENWPHIHSEAFDYNDGLIEKTVDLFWKLVKGVEKHKK